jgi:hypothetical protein
MNDIKRSDLENLIQVSRPDQTAFQSFTRWLLPVLYWREYDSKERAEEFLKKEGLDPEADYFEERVSLARPYFTKAREERESMVWYSTVADSLDKVTNSGGFVGQGILNGLEYFEVFIGSKHLNLIIGIIEETIELVPKVPVIKELYTNPRDRDLAIGAGILEYISWASGFHGAALEGMHNTYVVISNKVIARDAKEKINKENPSILYVPSGIFEIEE